MSLADFLPLRDVRHKHARADNIFHAGSGFLQSTLDIFQNLDGLDVCVSHAHDLAVRPRRCGAGDMDIRSKLYCARVTHGRFPRCTTGDVHSFHLSVSSLAEHFLADRSCRSSYFAAKALYLAAGAWVCQQKTPGNLASTCTPPID